MEILENKAEWSAYFSANWLAHARETGQADWKIYKHPRNADVPGTQGISLANSRLLLITSAGAYLRKQQEPFDAASLYGDYEIRTLPVSTPFTEIAYAHDHYNHAMINADPQVALPLPYLQELAANGRIGSLTSSLISFMGYQPDSARVVDETIPPILEHARRENVEAALLAPV